MCNYNRQSKTKPFTFNEVLSERRRLPQGGILMKQMAECSQGQMQNVLLFTVCQHFQLSEELHLSLDRSLCPPGRECARAKGFRGVSQDERENPEEYQIHHSPQPAAHLQKG